MFSLVPSIGGFKLCQSYITFLAVTFYFADDDELESARHYGVDHVPCCVVSLRLHRLSHSLCLLVGDDSVLASRGKAVVVLVFDLVEDAEALVQFGRLSATSAEASAQVA